MLLIAPIPHKVNELEINGKKPFSDWLKTLKDHSGKAQVIARIRRIEETGNFGEY